MQILKVIIRISLSVFTFSLFLLQDFLGKTSLALAKSQEHLDKGSIL